MKFIPIIDEEEQVVFYDAVEDADQLSSEEEMPSMLVTDPRLRQLRDKMAGIHRRRAKLRTKKVPYLKGEHNPNIRYISQQRA